MTAWLTVACGSLAVSNIVNARLVYWQRKLINALRAESSETQP